MAATQQQGLALPGVAVAPRRILFHLAGQAHLHQSNAQGQHAHGGGGGGSASGTPPRRGAKEPEDSAPEVEQVPLALAFHAPSKVGAGLSNLGNTCFLNSVLQCLTYTPPLAGYLQSGHHRESCRVPGFCAVCSLEDHVRLALASAGKSIAPSNLVKNLRSISRTFRMWRQEDAHEYMRCLLEALLKCSLPSHNAAAAAQQEKSFVFRIFGGRLRSQVKCTVCSHSSNTYDPFLDLSLDIVRTESLTKALSRFTAVDELDGENKYRCGHCKKKVRAEKNFTIDSAPNVLTIQFKRFSSTPGRFGKIDKKVDFGRTLDLTPYMSRKEGEFTYSLYGVLVHSGGSTHSGHYFCFVRTSSGIWHLLDDSRVRQVSESQVMDQKAYILFYVRNASQISNSKADPSGPEYRQQLGPEARLAQSRPEECLAHPRSEEPLAQPRTGGGPTLLRSEECLTLPCTKELRAEARCEDVQAQSHPEERSPMLGLEESRSQVGSEKCKVHASSVEQNTETGLKDLSMSEGILQPAVVEGQTELQGEKGEGEESEANVGGPSISGECSTQLDLEENKIVGSEDCSPVADTGDADRQLGAEGCSVHPGSEECSTSGYDTDEYVTDHQVKTPAAYILLLQHNHRTRRLFLSRRTPHRARKRSFDSDSMEVDPSDPVSSDVEGGMSEQVLNLDLTKQAGDCSVIPAGGDEATDRGKEPHATFEAAECPVDKLDKDAQDTCLRANGASESTCLGQMDIGPQSKEPPSVVRDCKLGVDVGSSNCTPDVLEDCSSCLSAEPGISSALPDKEPYKAGSNGSWRQQNPLYGFEVPRWNESDETAMEVDALLSSHHKPVLKRVDEWDEEYDRGKVKKVRRRADQSEKRDEQHGNEVPLVNPFQQAASRK